MKSHATIFNKLLVYRIVSSHDGNVNKTALFDKDIMFLVIFGLRGMKHELESRVALRCAADLLETFESWPEILSVSIGVTSGMTYCGVVGHSLRREYSVISVTVNKAARLMMAYPRFVSCDCESLLQSKLDMKHFTALPKIKLKGFRDDIVAYKFKELIEKMELEEPIAYTYPMLGRTEIMSLSQKLIIAAILNYNQSGNKSFPDSSRNSCLLIKGETQLGKSRVLNEIYSKCCNDKMECMYLRLSIKNSKFSLKALFKIIIRKALHMHSNVSSWEIQVSHIIFD